MMQPACNLFSNATATHVERKIALSNTSLRLKSVQSVFKCTRYARIIAQMYLSSVKKKTKTNRSNLGMTETVRG